MIDKKKEIVKVSWSGGKDSTCAMIKHLEMGNIIKAVHYTPMLTDNIPLFIKEHHEFIKGAVGYFRRKGVEVYIVNGISYYDFVHKRLTRGKNKGKIVGFPCFIPGKCNFSRDSKVKSIENVEVGYYDYEDIGIAVDELNRLKQLTEKKRSILYENGITEKMAKEICEEHNLLSPLYKRFKRDGCALCPNASKEERKQWFKDYPEAVDIVLELQNFVKKERPEQAPLRNKKFFIEIGGELL